MSDNIEKSNVTAHLPYNSTYIKNLNAILDQYENIPKDDIIFFFPVFYPIAILDIMMEENDFEDFDFINWSVLRIISLGICDSEVISKTLGMSKVYIDNIIKILLGYGYIDEKFQLSELGKMSLSQRKKITKHKSAQKFQADALSGRLIKVNENTIESNLKDPMETTVKVPHIDYRGAVIQESEIEKKIKNSPQDYLKERGSFLNVNVVNIESIKLDSVKYCRCYLMKLKNHEPVIFNIAKNKYKITYEPIGIGDESFRSYLGIKGEIVALNSDFAKQKLSVIYEYVKSSVQSDISEIIKEIYPFSPNTYNLIETDKPIISFSKKSFKVFKLSLIDILASIADNGNGIFTCENLSGKIINLHTDDEELILLGKRIKNSIRKIYKSALVSKYDGFENPFEIIDEILDLIDKKEN